ncbi:thiol:disulfide interchange protein DsbA/DsbL [Inmirania thermothiophila]|uniref:Thiol:disulfide interchange protein n=1 Tax=Inmirania thermothiophila TaxID=1750597 RepID=A0A3N1Y651_9GAMM|nr:thiol:disulfide interchange protein DsbA/DsbL [Inmirania thermothiophila]ROR34284.1 thiol:disulfide interchange protein DsbA [Inmirania thermothiophila]
MTIRRILSALVLVLGLARAAGAAEYEPLAQPLPTADPAKVEVVEVFWYGCPHCYRLLPYMERWLRHKPDYVLYRRLPGILRPEWALHARAYYTAEILGVADELHRPLFDAIHAERRPLDTEQALEDFFAEHGVDREAFRRTFRSFAVETRVRQARALMQRYGVQGTPTVIVNGKYRTDGSMAGSYADLVRVVQQLVEREAEALRR